MSWGYWGIVIGLVMLLALFFVCMEILYSSGARKPRTGLTGSPSGGAERPATRSRRAA